MRALVDHLLSGFRWYRRLRGGHWERWWVDPPVASDVWIQNPHGHRPGMCHGTPVCEEYGPTGCDGPPPAALEWAAELAAKGPQWTDGDDRRGAA